MKTRFTALALRDLTDIARWIATDRPNAAKSVIRKLRRTCSTLSDHPNGYALLAGREQQGVRRAPHGRWSICYRVEADSVVILRILDSAQDIDALL